MLPVINQGLGNIAEQPDEARHTQQQSRPQFTWNQKNPNNTVPEFLLRPGPTHVWGGELSPMNCFQLFWDDELFEILREMTNKNAERKRTENPENREVKHQTF